MIRLAYTLFEGPIELQENTVEVIVLENQKAYREFIFELKNSFQGQESKIVFSKDYDEISVTKGFDLICDALFCDINNKRILAKMVSNLKDIAVSPEHYLNTLEVCGTINSFLSTLVQTSECSLSFNEVDIDILLKAVNIKVDTENTNFLEKLCEYVLLLNECCGINTYVFIGLKTFLTKEELVDFYKLLNYKKINLILVENKIDCSLNNEHITLIDGDLCNITQ